LIFFTVSLLVTLFANLPFGFYQNLAVPYDVYPDTAFGIHFFGNWIIDATTVLDLSYILGATLLNFLLFYIPYFIFTRRRKK
jgi:hypothetical protein